MIMKTEHIAPCTMAYIRQTGPYGPDNIKTMERLKHWAKSRNLMNGHSVILGIAQDDPRITPQEKCRYDACILLPGDYSFESSAPDQNVHYGSITGGNYGVFTIDHTAGAIQQAWEEVLQQLFAENYVPDSSRPILERYKAELVERHLCEICVPIQ
ncbi:AraC family transcriptional regulator [Lacrimispora sp.]|jgi:DNA gyrase inhibitor GyrI|uniref:AraC family transcriptional regulator n=1 Tax=Lacrimispora sp. TaxID=2719234 RepID=UPI002897CAEA|nr:GyrI-like domain-containing protein [Lacrimispora sp.]